MQIRKIIQRRIRQTSKGVDVAGDLNAAIAANVGEKHAESHAAALNVLTDKSTAVPDEDDADDARRRREETQ